MWSQEQVAVDNHDERLVRVRQMVQEEVRGGQPQVTDRDVQGAVALFSNLARRVGAVPTVASSNQESKMVCRRRPICADCGDDSSISNWRTSPVPWVAGILWEFFENRLGSTGVRHEVVERTISRSVDSVVEESRFPGNSSWTPHLSQSKNICSMRGALRMQWSPISEEGKPHCSERFSSSTPFVVASELLEQLDEVNLEQWLRVPTLKKCPHFMRGRLRHCFAVALSQGGPRTVAEERAWKLFPEALGVRGRWTDLLENIHDTSRQPKPAICQTSTSAVRLWVVCAKVRCRVRGRSSLAQLWHPRLWRLSHSCKRESYKKKGQGDSSRTCGICS